MASGRNSGRACGAHYRDSRTTQGLEVAPPNNVTYACSHLITARWRGLEMGDAQSQINATKDKLETEKLLLETQSLQRQLSVRGVLLAWLQAASVPVALLGAILAFFVGFGQLRQGADSQAADRFDKALTRLASERPDERMTGVSGLNLFLNDASSPLQSQALQFLINRLSLETDARVQGIILDVLNDLKPG